MGLRIKLTKMILILIGIDNFFVILKNMVLSYLQRNDLKEQKLFANFYENICKPLFEDRKSELIKVILFFYEPEKYIELQKKYNINSNDIEPLLYGYRFCLNELFFKNEDNEDLLSTLFRLFDKKILSRKWY